MRFTRRETVSGLIAATVSATTGLGGSMITSVRRASASGEVLVIESNETHRINTGTSERYDSAEIRDQGALVMETDAGLELAAQ